MEEIVKIKKEVYETLISRCIDDDAIKRLVNTYDIIKKSIMSSDDAEFIKVQINFLRGFYSACACLGFDDKIERFI